MIETALKKLMLLRVAKGHGPDDIHPAVWYGRTVLEMCRGF